MRLKSKKTKNNEKVKIKNSLINLKIDVSH